MKESLKGYIHTVNALLRLMSMDSNTILTVYVVSSLR